MGTGIVATAGATLPVRIPGLHVFARAVWVVAAILLVVLIVAVTAHWLRHPTVARSHAYNPQMAHFYGAAPMALLTVGAGAVLVGKDLIGRTLGRRSGLGAVERGHGGRTVHRDVHPLSDVHAVQRRTGRRLRRLVDAGRPADGFRGDRCLADPAHGTRHGPRNHAVRLLCDVRAVVRRRDDHHHHGVEPSRALRDIGHRTGSDTVDRSRPARSIHHGRRLTRDQRGPGRRRPSGRRHGRLRDPVRRPGVGLRGAVDRAGHRADGPDRAAWHAVRADVVEPHVPCRHLRHRHHPAGRPHRPARVPGRGRRRLCRPAGHLGPGGGPHRAREPAWKSVPAAGPLRARSKR